MFCNSKQQAASSTRNAISKIANQLRTLKLAGSRVSHPGTSVKFQKIASHGLHFTPE
jgi:hypothetical protein